MYDNPEGDDNADDDEKALQEALALSMLPNPAEADAAKADQPAETKQPLPAAGADNVDLDADLLKDVIGDLGIDIDEG